MADHLNKQFAAEADVLIKQGMSLATRLQDLIGMCTKHYPPERDCPDCEPALNTMRELEQTKGKLAALEFRSAMEAMDKHLQTHLDERPWWKRIFHRNHKEGDF